MSKISITIRDLLIGLIVTAVGIFIFTPLSNSIIKKDDTNQIISEKEKSNTSERQESGGTNNANNNNGGTRAIISKNGHDTPNQKEDFSSFINKSFSNPNNETNIAVTVVDINGNISSSVSSSIANIYNQTGLRGNTGLLRSSFIHNPGFIDLTEGNSEIIDQLELNNHADYVAIGKISYMFKKGNLVDATFVCSVTLVMNLISANQKKLIKSFTCSAIGNGVTEDQAKDNATDKLLNKYFSEYSSI